MTGCAFFDCDSPANCNRYEGEFPNQIDHGAGACVGCERFSCDHCWERGSIGFCLLFGGDPVE